MKRNAARKEKFGLLNFGSVEVLSKEEMKKVTGGYGGSKLGMMCVTWSPMTSSYNEIRYSDHAGTSFTIMNHNVTPASSSYGSC